MRGSSVPAQFYKPLDISSLGSMESAAFIILMNARDHLSPLEFDAREILREAEEKCTVVLQAVNAAWRLEVAA